MIYGNLLEGVKITKLTDATAAGTSAINSGIVDMAGYDGVVFLTSTGTVLATGTATIKAQQGAASNLSDAADLTGTSQSFVDTDDNKSVAIDIKRPVERYLRCVITRAVANSDWGPIWALQYRTRQMPVTQGLDKSESFVSPVEGTA